MTVGVIETEAESVSLAVDLGPERQLAAAVIRNAMADLRHCSYADDAAEFLVVDLPTCLWGHLLSESLVWGVVRETVRTRLDKLRSACGHAHPFPGE